MSRAIDKRTAAAWLRTEGVQQVLARVIGDPRRALEAWSIHARTDVLGPQVAAMAVAHALGEELDARIARDVKDRYSYRLGEEHAAGYLEGLREARSLLEARETTLRSGGRSEAAVALQLAGEALENLVAEVLAS